MTQQMSSDQTAAREAGLVAIEIQCEKVATLIAAARRLLKENRMVDLGALEGMVRDLCTDIRDIPGEAAEGIMQAVQAIMSDLDTLQAELTAHQERIAGQMEASTRVDALQAYGPGAGGS